MATTKPHNLKMTPEMKAAILEMLEEVPNITAVRKMFGISSSAIYDARNSDPEWSKAIDEARESGYDMMEEEARRRAVEGWNEPVYYKGECMGEVRRYSDSLLKFLLTHCKPQKFNPGIKVTANKDSVRLIFEVGQGEE